MQLKYYYGAAVGPILNNKTARYWCQDKIRGVHFMDTAA